VVLRAIRPYPDRLTDEKLRYLAGL
jgi:hypothetical protein